MTWSPASGRKELEARHRQVGGQEDSGINPAAAAPSLEHFLALGTHPASRHEAATLLQQVKARPN